METTGNKDFKEIVENFIEKKSKQVGSYVHPLGFLVSLMIEMEKELGEQFREKLIKILESE